MMERQAASHATDPKTPAAKALSKGPARTNEIILYRLRVSPALDAPPSSSACETLWSFASMSSSFAWTFHQNSACRQASDYFHGSFLTLLLLRKRKRALLDALTTRKGDTNKPARFSEKLRCNDESQPM